MRINVDGTIPTVDNISYQRKICPAATFFTRNLKRDISDLEIYVIYVRIVYQVGTNKVRRGIPGSNTDLRFESPATNRRGQDTVPVA